MPGQKEDPPEGQVVRGGLAPHALWKQSPLKFVATAAGLTGSIQQLKSAWKPTFGQPLPLYVGLHAKLVAAMAEKQEAAVLNAFKSFNGWTTRGKIYDVKFNTTGALNPEPPISYLFSEDAVKELHKKAMNDSLKLKKQNYIDDEEGTTDLEEVLRRYDADQASKNIFKPKKAGSYYIRILPPPTKGLYYVPFGMHFSLQTLANQKAADMKIAACLKKTLDVDCPLCQLASRFYFESKRPDGTVDGTKLNLAKKIRGSDRFVMNVVDMDNPKAGVLTWEVGRQTHDMIRSVFKEWKDVTHPKSGRVLKVTYEDQGEFGAVCKTVMATSRQDAIPVDGWKGALNDLQAYSHAQLHTADELLEVIQGSGKKKAAPKPAAPSFADDEDDEEVVSGAEDEEQPKAAAVDEEEEDDLDEDEDEDAEEIEVTDDDDDDDDDDSPLPPAQKPKPPSAVADILAQLGKKPKK